MAFGLLSLESSVIVIFLSIISYAVFKPDSNTLHLCTHEAHRLGATLNLRDGRKLGYAEYGPQGGRPVLHFHPMPASRLFSHPDISDITKSLNIRLIIVDQPGVGWSTIAHHPNIHAYVSTDISQLVDHLNLKNFWVSGHSAGSATALAVGYVFQTKVEGISLIGPVVLPSSVGASGNDKEWEGWSDGLRPGNKFLSGIGMDHPMILSAIWKFFTGHMTDVEAVLKDVFSSPDESILVQTDDRWRQLFSISVAECFRQGTEAMYQTLAVTVPTPWGFGLPEITTRKVDIWRCTGDAFTSNFMATYLQNKIPQAKIHLLNERCGHWSLWGLHLRDILKKLVGEP